MSVCTSYTLASGTYYVSGGDVSISGANVVGNNVAIVLTSTNGSGKSSVQISSNATGSLSAPLTGTFAGIIFDQYNQSGGTGNNSSCQSPANSINANGGLTLDGTIYLPSQPLCFSGTPTTLSGGCLQLYAYQMSISGNPTFDDTGCVSGTTGNNIKTVSLVQ